MAIGVFTFFLENTQALVWRHSNLTFTIIAIQTLVISLTVGFRLQLGSPAVCRSREQGHNQQPVVSGVQDPDSSP
jgi:hypothetical protein